MGSISINYILQLILKYILFTLDFFKHSEHVVCSLHVIYAPTAKNCGSYKDEETQLNNSHREISAITLRCF